MQETEPTQQPFPLHGIIEGLIQQLGEKYVSPEKVQEVAATLRQHLEQRIYDGIRDGETLAQTITEHMQVVSHDKHLNLFYRAGVQPDLPVAGEEALDIAYHRALASTQ